MNVQKIINISRVKRIEEYSVKSTLILFTNIFPYGKGETFIETEIEYLSKKFNKIIIIPSAVYKNSKITRKLPNNCIVEPIYINSLKYQQIIHLLKGIKYLYSNADEWTIAKQYTEISIPKKVYYSYSMSLAKSNYRDVLKILNKYDFKNNKLFFYSYWLNYMAYVSVKLRQNIYKKSAVFCRAHGGDLYDERQFLEFPPLKAYSIENIDKVFACSENGKLYLQDKFFNYKEKISTARLGTNNYGASNFDKREMFTIISCSNLINLKRIDLIIQALSLLNFPIKWVHFGDGILKNDLINLAKSKLNSNIEYTFLGYVENKKVMEFYKNNHASLFLNVSSDEGVPVSIMEAISFGIPVIATNVGGTSEIVNNLNGHLLNKDFDIKELAENISKFYNMHDEEYLEYRGHARRTWETNYDSDINYLKYVNEISVLNNNIKEN